MNFPTKKIPNEKLKIIGIFERTYDILSLNPFEVEV